jgi:glycosyltransferase involved in cell wall biosynthesis
MVDAMSLISTTLQRDAVRRGARHTHLLPSAEDFSAAPPEHPVRSGPYRIAYMGAMLPRDNPAFLADLVDALAARGSSVQFDIAGRYESVREADPFVARLAAHFDSGRVRLHGKLGDAELGALLAGADALILPRRDAPAEVAAFPTRLAECLRTGRPVLACAVGDIPYHLRDGEDAVLLDPADPIGAAAKVEALAASPDRGRALGVRGYLRGRERFDRIVHAKALLDLADRIRRK